MYFRNFKNYLVALGRCSAPGLSVGVIFLLTSCGGGSDGGGGSSSDKPAPEAATASISASTPSVNNELSVDETPVALSCGDIKHGDSTSRVKYQSSSVAYGQNCQPETQVATCNDGTLAFSGSFSFDSCSINDPLPPVIELSELIIEKDSTLTIDLSDMQTGSPVDEGNYYHECYFDNTVDGTVAKSNDCNEFNSFSYDFLYNGNGIITFNSSPFDEPGVYEMYFQTESIWGTSHTYVPTLIKESYTGGEKLIVDLDARFANRTQLSAQTPGSQNAWSNIASSSSQSSKFNLHGVFSSGWVGTGTPVTDPYSLAFDGINGINASRIKLGTDFNDEQNLSLSIWMKANQTSSNRVIFSNQASANGFGLYLLSSGELKLSISDNTDIPSYDTVIIADNPIGYWPLNQATGATAINLGSSGANLDASYDSGAPNSSSDSRVNYSTSQRVTDGNERLRVSGHADMSDFSANGITVEAWVKSDTENWNSSNNFVSKRNQFILGGGANSKTVRFYINNGSSWISAQANVSNIDSWHHYAGTFDGTTIRLYVDGVEVATNTTTQIAVDTGDLAIGTDDMNNSPIMGNIQHVAIFDKVLSQANILNHATSGLLNSNSCMSVKKVTDRWVNSVVSFSATDASLYINGEKSCTVNLDAIGKSQTAAVGSLTLGSNVFGGESFSGNVASFKVYTKTLSNSEIESNFEALADLYLEAPETILGLVGWWDASESSTITTSGLQVTNWADRSMNKTDLVEKNPSLGAITVNTGASSTGLDTIHFDGTSQSYLINNSGGFAESVFAVYRYDNGPSFVEYNGIFSCSSSTPLAGNSGNQNLYTNWGSRFINGTQTSTHADINIFNQASAISTTGPTNSTYFNIGQFRTANSRAWFGDIGEVIVYDKPLTSAQRAKIEAYQQAKWGTP